MQYTYISCSWGQKSTSNFQDDLPNNEKDRCKISEWEVVLGASGRDDPGVVQFKENYIHFISQLKCRVKQNKHACVKKEFLKWVALVLKLCVFSFV